MLEDQENRQVYAAAFSVNAWTMLSLLLGNTPFFWVSIGAAPIELKCK